MEDRWNFWVFTVSLHSFLRGEQRYRRRSLWGDFFASRVTPEFKFLLDAYGDFEDSKFKVNEDEIKSSSEGWGLDTLYVRSLNDHRSAGGWLNFKHSTYSDIDFSYKITPAIEYNVFPYSEATRRQLRFLYEISLIRNKYIEETLYEKTQKPFSGIHFTLHLNLERYGVMHLSAWWVPTICTISKKTDFKCILTLR